MGPMTDAALVLFSGGQDSTACLAWALSRYGRVETVGFDYGQRHGVELQARQAVRARVAREFPEWAPRLGDDHMLDIRSFGALADRRKLNVLVGGMCETDFSGYPDCRRDTLDAMEQALNLGMAQDFRIETPLMRLTKAQTWALAKALGGETLVSITVEESHTCYLGERGTLHPWGYGCGTCPACELRRRGYEAWVAEGRPELAS